MLQSRNALIVYCGLPQSYCTLHSTYICQVAAPLARVGQGLGAGRVQLQRAHASYGIRSISVLTIDLMPRLSETFRSHCSVETICSVIDRNGLPTEYLLLLRRRRVRLIIGLGAPAALSLLAKRVVVDTEVSARVFRRMPVPPGQRTVVASTINNPWQGAARLA